uniref:Chromosome 9 open reading frame 78 n=1 Tax=Cyprinus carpio TaxID=7962 RepID=A0A8C2D463_CYPCA
MPSGKINRRRKEETSDEEDDETKAVVRSFKVFRKRQHGVRLKLPLEAELQDDPFKLKTGGVVDTNKVKDRNQDMTADENDLNLGTSFSAETNRRDEDADMMEYIEIELKKRKNPEDLLYELPENKTEKMLSNQMLSGIVEVDLGIDAKINNIIITEEAKAKLLAEQRNKKDNGTSFVPTNIAVYYVQHNRCKCTSISELPAEEPKARPLRVENTEKPVPETSPPNYHKRPNKEKATDDYHYEKFKMNRRY